MPKVMKRSAASELNSDNWDQDDEPEDAGTFKPVNQEELSKRVIKVAKRRLPTSKTGDEAKPLFSNFTGFGTASSGGKSSFSFLSNLNGSNSQSASQSKEADSVSSAQKTQEISSKKSEENAYLESLKSLNKCLLDWVDQCIKKNASCILTPIFKDYEKHLESLKKPVAGEEKSPKKPAESMSSFKFNSANNAGSQNTSSSTTTLQNSISPMSLSMTKTPSLKFNVPISSSSTGSWLSSSTVSKPSIFSSLGSTTNTTMATTTLPTPTFGIFSTSNPITTPSTDSENKDGGDDDETPPVNDFKPVTEDDALFSQRVKLFVQKDKQYSDRGVGMLYIKEAKDAKGNKIHQAIIRADTSLGNIIFNIRINSDIPTKRVGKNNVMLVCLPTPDAKPPPVPVLLRVKTAEEADKLLEEIDKYK